MNGLSLHLAPNAPIAWLAVASLAAAALALWAYAFRLPPLSPTARRVLALMRVASLAALAWLLAMPVLERSLPASSTRVTVLVDRSLSMDRPARPGGPSRTDVASGAVRELVASLRGRAQVEVRPFAGTLLGDSASAAGTADDRGATATGDALAALVRLPMERRPDGVVLVSDGAVNAGGDPVGAARALGVPVHTLLVGERSGLDRGIAGVEASSDARVGESTPVRVRVVSDEERGTPIGVKLEEGGRELAHATVLAPGPGAEVTAELRPVPTRAGLALWTARVTPLEGDLSPDDDAHGVAVPVAPGKLGVLVFSSALNWDLAFLRRALLGDTTLDLDTRVREQSGGWRALERARTAGLSPSDLGGKSVVVLDAISGADLGAPMDAALASFVHGGGGLLLFAGPDPGATRFARGKLASELAFSAGAPTGGQGSPEPQPAGAELLAWDDDQARGAHAWHDSPHARAAHRSGSRGRWAAARRCSSTAPGSGAGRSPARTSWRASEAAGCGERRGAGWPSRSRGSPCASPPSAGSCRAASPCDSTRCSRMHGSAPSPQPTCAASSLGPAARCGESRSRPAAPAPTPRSSPRRGPAAGR